MQAAALVRSRDTSMRVLPVTAGFVLVELADLGETLALLKAMHRDPIAGVGEIIPAARTLLVQFDSAEISLDALTDVLASRRGADIEKGPGPLVEIPVRYDGEDLQEVAGLTGTTVDEVVRRHCGRDYLVAFTGFAPGFAYLADGDPRLAVPRRTSPRTHVPAGSVGLAGAFSGIYPKASPGGWQLIGNTPLTMFDLDRTPASLLQPGYRVRFRDMAISAPYEIAQTTRKSPVKAATRKGAAIAAAMEITTIGLPVLFQDLGRPGQSHHGIGRSGAMDRGSLRAANRLVGNPDGAAALEIVLGGMGFRMSGRAVMAVSGAPVAITITDANGARVSAPHNEAFALDEGDRVMLGVPVAGMRSYLAMRGGFDVAPVLGSAATDTLGQIGPPTVLPGDVIPILAKATGMAISLRQPPAFEMPSVAETVRLDIVLGPRTDWFTQDAVSSFLSQDWTVTAQSSRVGIRLRGEPLERRNQGELPSEATVQGAIQVPASGQPVLFLADHPITGGYPVIANVAWHHLDLAGQIPVGARIRFNANDRFLPRTIPGKQI